MWFSPCTAIAFIFFDPMTTPEWEAWWFWSFSMNVPDT